MCQVPHKCIRMNPADAATYSRGGEAPSTPHPLSAAQLARFLLISGDFTRTGGMDMANYYLADYVAKRELPVHIVSHNVDPALTRYPNVSWHRVPRPRHSTLLGEPLLRWYGHRVARRLGSDETLAVVNGGNCALADVNWAHYVHAVGQPVSGGSWSRRAKTNLAHRLFVRQEAVAYRRARLIIANSKRTKDDLVKCHGIHENIIHSVYYGTNPKDFYPISTQEKDRIRQEMGLPRDRRLVVFVGALGDRRKGFDTLFQAWKNAASDVTAGTTLIVIGSGAELPYWQKLVAEERLGESIRFLGFRRDVPAILRASDGFAAPTRYEAFGLAVQEALCCGLPAVVSRSAGVAERYPSGMDDLLLNDPENVPELTARLENLIRHCSHWTAITRQLASSLREYTWEMMAQTIYDLATRDRSNNERPTEGENKFWID